MLLTMLLAVAGTVVTGDFDDDGVLDRAFVRSAGGQYHVVVSGRTGETIVHTVRASAPPVLSKLQPGTYATACAKGAGARTAPCDARSITIVGDALQFGTPESSQAAALWSGRDYRIVWISD
jgi:hypothetical protein